MLGNVYEWCEDWYGEQELMAERILLELQYLPNSIKSGHQRKRVILRYAISDTAAQDDKNGIVKIYLFSLYNSKEDMNLKSFILEVNNSIFCSIAVEAMIESDKTNP